MTKKRVDGRDDPGAGARARRQPAGTSSRREPPRGWVRARCWRRTRHRGRPAAPGADDVVWDYEVDVVIAGGRVRRPDRGHSRAGPRGQCAGGRSELRRRRPDVAQRVVRVARGRRPRPAPGRKGRERQGGTDHRRSGRGAGRAGRQRRPPVHRPHRLVGRRPQGPEPVPLQRARALPRVGRELPGHPAAPHRQLRPVHARQRHPRRRRPVARAGGALLPPARRQDRHQGRHDHGRRTRGSRTPSARARSRRCK